MHNICGSNSWNWSQGTKSRGHEINLALLVLVALTMLRLLAIIVMIMVPVGSGLLPLTLCGFYCRRGGAYVTRAVGGGFTTQGTLVGGSLLSTDCLSVVQRINSIAMDKSSCGPIIENIKVLKI
jgi:hypothetical protein